MGSQEPAWRTDEPFTQSYGDLAVRFAEAAGKPFFAWQVGSSTAALACDADGHFAHRSVVRLIPRQNGKNGEVEFIQIVKMLVLKRPLQVHSAHKMQTAREHFLRVREDIESLQKVDPSIRALSIRFKDSDNDRAIICDDFDTRIQFLARATGGGRGFTGDDLYLDEALYLTESMLGDILPASSAIPNAQIYYMSSHPKPHTLGPVLKMMRRGRAGKSRGTSYWEWGNEFHVLDDHPEGVDLTSRKALLKANPSFGATIGDPAVEDERDKMSAEEFARERYGCIDLRLDSEGWSVFSRAAWADLADEASVPSETLAVGVDMPPDMSTAVVAFASPRPDGRVHVQLVRHEVNPDAWLEDELKKASQVRPLGIGYESGSAVSASLKAMRTLRPRLVPLSNRDIGVATSLIQSKVRDKGLAHLDDPVLNDALKAAKLGKLTESIYRLTRRNTVEDISPAIAIANALYVLETNGRPERQTKRRGVVVMR